MPVLRLILTLIVAFQPITASAIDGTELLEGLEHDQANAETKLLDSWQLRLAQIQKEAERDSKLAHLKIERLRTMGGITKSTHAKACETKAQYFSLLDAQNGAAVLMPTDSECWTLEEGVHVTLSECENYFPSDYDAYINKMSSINSAFKPNKDGEDEIVCRFKYGWMGNSLWTSLSSVNYK